MDFFAQGFDFLARNTEAFFVNILAGVAVAFFLWAFTGRKSGRGKSVVEGSGSSFDMPIVSEGIKIQISDISALHPKVRALLLKFVRNCGVIEFDDIFDEVVHDFALNELLGMGWVTEVKSGAFKLDASVLSVCREYFSENK